MGRERNFPPDDGVCGKANGAKRSLENPGGGYTDSRLQFVQLCCKFETFHNKMLGKRDTCIIF